MRTQIEIDIDLIRAAMKASGIQTEEKAIEAGLKLLLRQQGYAQILALGGKLKWETQEDELPEPQQ